MKTLAKGESWSAPDTTLYFPIPGHMSLEGPQNLAKWLVQQLHKEHRERVFWRSKGFSQKP